MKYLLMLALVTIGSTAALASPATPTVPSEEKHQRREVRFDCFFRSPFIKGLRCEARGEVCVERRHHDGSALTEEERQRCDHDRDDNRLFIRCNDGFEDNDKAVARVLRDEDGRGTELLIRSRGDRLDEDRIRIVEFGRFERDNDRDDDRDHDRDRDDKFFATLRRDSGRFGEGRWGGGWGGGNGPWGDVGRLRGECRLRAEHHRQ